MRLGLLRSSRYSPGNMSHESLEALFVGREDIMADVLTRVADSIDGPGNHYLLLVGPRGSGKTHLLALAFQRLLKQLQGTEVRDSVAIAFLKEEEWGVASFLDLIVRLLRALAEEAPELEERIAEVYDRFGKDSSDAEDFALRLLREHVRDRTLLLLCENLADLFSALGEEGQQRLRATIQEDGNWTIVATTPALSAAFTLQQNPFYGFFTVRSLKAINLDTGIDLLVKKAHHEGKPELRGFLRTPIGRARARAIHHLAAGNHRAYVVLFDFLDKESLADLVEPFMHMVDDLTPYYQGKMQQLPPAQRKIVEFLCFEGTPATVKEVSSRCLMSHQTAAKQLVELEAGGFVAKTRIGRNTYCELAEPLMRICIEVKDNRTQHFRLFVEFLRHWFTNRELNQRRDAFLDGDASAHFDRVHVEEAWQCSLAEPREPVIDALEDEAQRCLDNDDFRGLADIQERLVLDMPTAENYSLWLYALVNANETDSAVFLGCKAEELFPQDSAFPYHLAVAYYEEGRFDEALASVDRAIHVGGDDSACQCIRADILIALGQFEEGIGSAQKVLDAEPDHWHSVQQIARAFIELGRPADAEEAMAEMVQFAPDDPSALLIAARFHLSRDDRDEALELIDKAIGIDPEDASARHLRGDTLLDIGDWHRASEDFRHLASRQPDSVPAHCRLADALLFSGAPEEAIAAADRLLELDPNHDHAHLVRGNALIDLDRPPQAVDAFDQLLSSGHPHSLLAAAFDVRAIGEYVAATRYLDRVAEIEPNNRQLWIERTRLCIDQGQYAAAADSAAKIPDLQEGNVLKWLLAAQAAAAIGPLTAALDGLAQSTETEDFESDEPWLTRGIARILAISVSCRGPLELAKGVVKLRNLLAHSYEGRIGTILTDVLLETVGSNLTDWLDDWDAALVNLEASLDDLPSCLIPLAMLRAASTCAKTGDRKHLLQLPREQRQLLEDILPDRPRV